MLPAQHDIAHYRGDEFSKRFRFTTDGQPDNLTGLPIIAQCRKTTDINAALLFAFTVVRDDPNGIVELTLEPAATAALQAGIYYWDLQIGTRTRVAGEFEIVPDISRATA